MYDGKAKFYRSKVHGACVIQFGLSDDETPHDQYKLDENESYESHKKGTSNHRGTIGMGHSIAEGDCGSSELFSHTSCRVAAPMRLQPEAVCHTRYAHHPALPAHHSARRRARSARDEVGRRVVGAVPSAYPPAPAGCVATARHLR